jgi:hypothetical protein
LGERGRGTKQRKKNRTPPKRDEQKPNQLISQTSISKPVSATTVYLSISMLNLALPALVKKMQMQYSL